MPGYDKPPKWMELDSSWMEDGACFDLGDGDGDLPPDERAFLNELFFSDDERGLAGRLRQVEAKRICWVECGHRSLCLAYAVEAEIEHGIWGGTTGPERLKIIRERRASAAA